VPICRYLSTNLCCEILFGGKEHCNKLCLYYGFFTVGSHRPHGTRAGLRYGYGKHKFHVGKKNFTGMSIMSIKPITEKDM